MLAVTVTVSVGKRTVPVDELADPTVASALRGAAHEIGQRLAAIRCPSHGTTATDVRIHFDAGGNADLQYASCCTELGSRIGHALG